MKLLQDIDQEFAAHLQFLKEFVAIPTVSSGSIHKEDMLRAGQWLQERCDEAGLTTTIRQAEGGHPAVVASTEPREHIPHLFLYGHYDVESPSGGDFRSNFDGNELQGPGAGGQKGLLVAHLCALRALRLVGGYQPVNLTLLIEGERVIGSPNLQNHLEFVAREHGPFDLALITTNPALEREGSTDPTLPPSPYRLRLSSSEKVLLEAAESIRPDTDSDPPGKVIEPFHTLLGTKALMVNFEGAGHSPDSVRPERFRDWITNAVETLHRIAERYQAQLAEEVASSKRL